MSKLKSLISEIHRRSLWQVLLVYVGAAWACFELIATVADTMGLPGWLPGFAIVLFLLALPVVLATAFVREDGLATGPPAEGAEAEAVIAHREARRRHRGLTWRNAGFGFMAVLAVWGIVATGWLLFVERAAPEAADARKSIAVLPLENLSREEATEPFTDGIHDDILTHLYKIADLKVISRTSVLEYRDTKKNLREIAAELGVATILEGGVQRAGNRVRINVQLIDAETDEHLWAETYEEDLTAENVFAIQTDIAQRIAVALKAQLTSDERERIAARPTDNLEAYELYLKSKEASGEMVKELLERAIALDPDFALAYGELSLHHMEMFQGNDMSAERLALARESADKALEITPGLSVAHLALGQYHYFGHRDYERALAQFKIALESAPGDETIHTWIGYSQRRLGRFEAALTSFETAARLAPVNTWVIRRAATTHLMLRHWEEAEIYLDRIVALRPESVYSYFWKAWLYLCWRGDRKRALELQEEAVARSGWVLPDFTGENGWVMFRILHPHFDDALWRVALEGFPWESSIDYFSLRAMSAQLSGEPEVSRAYYDSARVVLEQQARDFPDEPRVRSRLGLAYAGLGREADAVREGELAMRVAPVASDPVWGRNHILHMAEIYVMTGDHEKAIDMLERLVSVVAEYTPHLLRLDPTWDPLRDHPRFQALLAKHE